MKSNGVKDIFSPGKLKETYSNFAPIYELLLLFFLCHLNDINRFLLFVKKSGIF